MDRERERERENSLANCIRHDRKHLEGASALAQGGELGLGGEFCDDGSCLLLDFGMEG